MLWFQWICTSFLVCLTQGHPYGRASLCRGPALSKNLRLVLNDIFFCLFDMLSKNKMKNGHQNFFTFFHEHFRDGTGLTSVTGQTVLIFETIGKKFSINLPLIYWYWMGNRPLLSHYTFIIFVSTSHSLNI